ncbi:hypothetical protein [Streptomyces adonidis]
MSLRGIRKRAAALVVTVIATVALVPLATQAPAQAAPNVAAGPTA